MAEMHEIKSGDSKSEDETEPLQTDINPNSPNINPNSPFFNDGKRRIDFVLVHEVTDDKKTERVRSCGSCFVNNLPDTAYTEDKKKEMREEYEKKLKEIGMEVEHTPEAVCPGIFWLYQVCPWIFWLCQVCLGTKKNDSKLKFVKIHMTWELLCRTAEWLHIKLPIKLSHEELSNKHLRGKFAEWLHGKLPTKLSDEKLSNKHGKRGKCAEFLHKKLPSEFLFGKKCFTAPYEDHLKDHFDIDSKDSDKTFTPSMRIRMAYYILNFLDLQMLLATGVYKYAYPVHDCSLKVKSEDAYPTERFKLYQDWAHLKNLFKMQPLNRIRKYYGEKIAMYFAWMGFYTVMLVFPAIVGLACFMYGVMTREENTWSKEVCDPEIGGSIVMCPQCDKQCNYRRLNSTCESSKILSVFDNFGTLVFAVFMSIWVTLFLEFWKRYQAKLKYEWDTMEQEDTMPRLEYVKKSMRTNGTHINPITKEEEDEPYTSCQRRAMASLGNLGILFLLLLSLAAAIGIIVYRLAVFFSFWQLRDFLVDSNSSFTLLKYVTPQMATTFTASIISFTVITILNFLYEKVAKWITDYEAPRTKTEYDNSLSMKIFLVQFVNSYSACFYIAFIKGKVVGYPGQPVYLLGKFRNEECDPGGCMMELTIKLAVILGLNASWDSIKQLLRLPLRAWYKNLRRKCLEQDKTEIIPRWEQDHHLVKSKELGVFHEYLEMVIQFGFVTMFAPAFPLGPVLALLNNLFEIRIDAWKITRYRRKIPEMVKDIGLWMPILQCISVLAVTTNAIIVAFTSDMIPRLVYYWSFSVYPYGDHSNYTMEGYINNTLSVFNIEDFTNQSKPTNASTPDWFTNSTTCRYRGFRYPPGHSRQYEYSNYFWHVLTARVVFIVVVEHVVYLTKFVLYYVIPDVPKAVNIRIRRERHLTQAKLHDTLNNNDSSEGMVHSTSF